MFEKEHTSMDESADDANAPLAQIQDWLAQWTSQRQTLRQLIREYGQRDPTYSWLTADRELLLMDEAVRRLNMIISRLQEPPSEAGKQ